MKIVVGKICKKVVCVIGLRKRKKEMLVYIYLIILFIITGIIAGYLTNLYAVRWLFRPIKKKGRLPAWDVSIVSTDKKKQKLVESLADCVTNSILTSDVLKEGISDALIEKHLYQMADKVFDQEDSNQLYHVLWKDLPAFEEVKEKGNHYIEKVISNQIAPFCYTILNQGDLSDYLTEKQIQSIAENLYEILEKEAGKQETYSLILEALYTDNKRLIIEAFREVLEKEVFFIFLKKKLTELFKDREKLESVWEKIIKELEVLEQMEKVQKKIAKKKMSDVIQSYEWDQLLEYFWKELGNYWRTVEGRRVLRYRKKEILEFLLSMDVPLGDMLSEETWNEIEKWIQNNVLEVIPPIINFIRENEDELNEVIERSIHIAAEKNNKSLGWLEETIQLFLVSQVNISERLQNILETIKENDSDSTVGEIVDFLKNQKISEIVQKLTSETKKYTWIKICRNRKWFDQIKQITYEYIKDKPLSWILERFSISIPELVCEKGKKLAFDYIEKNPDKIAEQLLKYMKSTCQEWNTSSVSEVEQENIKKASNYLFDKTNGFVKTEKKAVVSRIKQWILEDKLLKNFYKEQLSEEKIQKRLIQQWHQWEEKTENTTIGALISLLNREELKKNVVKTAVQKLRGGMEEALQGQIHHLVVEALNKLEPNELCNQVERLMGGQLKYLSYFGGFLGFLIAGALCYWAVPDLSVYGSPITWTGGILSVVGMGVIGVITNIVAIYMLFRPRRPIQWLAKSKYLYLFSEGVILQNQSKFAKAMAAYVSEELISEKAVRQLYEAKKTDFPVELKQWIDTHGMEMLKQNRNDIAEGVVRWMLQYSQDGIKQLKKWLEGQRLNTLVSSGQLNQFAQQVNVQAIIQDQYSKWKNLNREKQLSNWILEDDFNQVLLNLIRKKELKWIESARQISLEKLAAQKEEWYHSQISKQWTLEQKKNFHLLLERKWQQVDTREKKEKIVAGLIQKCTILRENDTLVGEFKIANRSVQEWGNIVLEKKLEDGIEWFYNRIIKKKIEQMFGYEQLKPMEEEDWWETIQKNIARFGMQSIIEPIFRDAIWELKEVQLPLYLKSKKMELGYIVDHFLEERVYSVSVGNVVKGVLGEEYPAALNRILFNTIWKNSSEFNGILKRMAQMSLNLILDPSPSVYLHRIRMDSLIAIEKKFRPELEMRYYQLLNMEQEKQVVAIEMASLLSPVVLQIQVKELTNLFEEDKKRIIQILVSEKNLELVINQLVEPMCKKYSISQIVSVEELERSVQKVWDFYIEKNKLTDLVKSIIADQIWNITENGWSQIPDSLRMELGVIFIDTAEHILQSQLQEIMQDLNLYEMTEQRLLALTPEEMEETIRAFADPIFKTLYGLGFLGAVGGINCYIAIIIYFIEKVHFKFKNQKDEKNSFRK